MLLDYLERVAVPLVSILAGSGSVIAVWLARRQGPVSPPVPPPAAAQAPAPTEGPSSPPNPPDPHAEPREVVERYLLAQVARIDGKFDDLQDKFDRVVEEVQPLIEWLDDGAHPPAPVLSEVVRRIIFKTAS